MAETEAKEKVKEMMSKMAETMFRSMQEIDNMYGKGSFDDIMASIMEQGDDNLSFVKETIATAEERAKFEKQSKDFFASLDSVGQEDQKQKTAEDVAKEIIANCNSLIENRNDMVNRCLTYDYSIDAKLSEDVRKYEKEVSSAIQDYIGNGNNREEKINDLKEAFDKVIDEDLVTENTAYTKNKSDIIKQFSETMEQEASSHDAIEEQFDFQL